MKPIKPLPSLLPLPSLMLVCLAALTTNTASCTADKACFYFTQVEFDIDSSCPSREEALDFFRGDFCSTPITQVNSNGEFDGSTCCYEVTESNEFFDCGIGPIPEPTPGSGVTSSGVAGAGNMGGFGGGGGMGGSPGCSRCAEFLTNSDPLPLCTDSIPIYEGFSDCQCNGPCKTACADACMGKNASMACETCLIDPDPATGCGKQLTDCSNDN